MVVAYFRAAPNGVHVCFSLRTPCNPSASSEFVAWSNHLFSCAFINPLCSRNPIVAVLKCFVLAPWPLLYDACVVHSVVTACFPATSEYSCLASAKLQNSSLASATVFTGEVNPILAMAQTLPTTNPSECVGGLRAHALSSFAPIPCSPWRHSTTLFILSAYFFLPFTLMSCSLGKWPPRACLWEQGLQHSIHA